MGDDANGQTLAADLARIVNLEIALRNVAAPWATAFEVVSRLAGRRRFIDPARRVGYLMRGCSPLELIPALAELRAALEEEQA